MQWWIFRLPPLFLLPFILYDFEIFILIQSFLFFHVSLGLKTIINDYTHNKNQKYLYYWLSVFLILN
uniref:Succinate:cytochrome c oxidoreductase subunit 4 n=1 Tax=Sporolithon durum TaxID=48970 RepID=V9P5C6_9FLOR|nr:succinate:cytochrome c oxidoreductase subunit 4 [Sporolithon durum]AGU16689.1 succinate:cytochrome c oxidoreductase subunit 4 [Sporolithon durum]